MTFALAGRRVRLDLGHGAFVTALAGWCLWYFLDARAAADDVQNLMLIEPLAILAGLLWLFLLKGCVHLLPLEAGGNGETAAAAPLPPKLVLRVGGSMALLVLYVLGAGTIGFDVATWAYILAELLLLGERRKLVLLLLPLGFTAVVIYAFGTLLANPLPLAFGNPA